MDSPSHPATPRRFLCRLAIVLFGAAICSAPITVAGTNHTNALTVPDDPVIRQGAGGPGWVKFLILSADPTTVYFQDSNLYSFHYEFAVAELPQFAGMTPQQFENATLYSTGQQATLGAVLIPQRALGQHVTPEYGIQIVRRDPYTATETRDLLQTVDAAITSPPGYSPFYMPTFEQFSVAQTNAAFFAAGGFPVSGPERWDEGNSCYSMGWAIGTLKFFPADQIEGAFLTGQLLPQDILLTDGVPAEIPLVAGVITQSPSTPNSHVALLSQTFNVPFTFLSQPRDLQKAQSLVGHRVALRVRSRFAVCEVRIVDTDGQLDTATVDSLLALKVPPPLAIDPVAPYGSYSVSTNGLAPGDIQYVGGKAAHMGILRQSIPADSPISAAITFELWTEFLNQPRPGSITLRQEIAQILAPFSYPPGGPGTDMQALDDALGGIRDLLEDDAETVFSTASQTGVIVTLQDAQYGFDPNQKIRFRSSTNVEDNTQFTGAGLYESKSGCLADELDGDSSGPSLCDPTEPNERGVFRAIRRVFSSFYNLNPYLERLRHGVDEDDVGMGMLVHHSFPDPIELANGTGTFHYGPGSFRDLDLVLQPDANSVTNPSPGQIPEEVDVYISTFSTLIYPTILRPSNLLQLGDTVLEFPSEYETLGQLLVDAADRYATVTGGTEFVLDFEFKKVAPHGQYPAEQLVVTQVRPVPQADDQPTLTPFLLNEPTDYCLFQGEGGGSVFANHRLKSRWHLETLNTWLTPATTAVSFYTQASMDYLEGCGRFTQDGPLSTWPNYGYTYDPLGGGQGGAQGGQATDNWSFADLQNPRTYRLHTGPIPDAVSPQDSPLVLLTDFGTPIDYSDLGCLSLEVDYAQPVLDAFDLTYIQVSTDYGMLCRCAPDEATDLIVNRNETSPGLVTVDTTYRWPKPLDVAAGYTAPLIRFHESTVTGLTSEPIVMTDYDAQTYKPGHHNFTAEFLFQPALDPAVSPSALVELEVSGTPLIYAFFDFSGFTVDTITDEQWNYHCLDCRGPDADGDSRCASEPTWDCNDDDPDVWALPEEVTNLLFTDPITLIWSTPSAPGGSSILFDLIQSPDPAAFAAGICSASNLSASSTLVPDTPPPGGVDSFLVRGVNNCPAHDGSSGVDSQPNERAVITCP